MDTGTQHLDRLFLSSSELQDNLATLSTSVPASTRLVRKSDPPGDPKNEDAWSSRGVVVDGDHETAISGDMDISTAGVDDEKAHEDEGTATAGTFTRPSGHPSRAVKYAPLPLPAATLRTTPANSAALQTTAADREPRGKNPPRLAVSLLNKRYAGYRPWTGNGAEDQLNDSAIRNGFSDKAPASSQNESNMARPIIWPNLKNKTVLPALSTLFVQVMDKRQALGRCTAPSTFKPPPRVTLTDTKREAWLRDLASQDVPLRRLSRTIPHGIRGRILLDQCLGKRVPIPRAIWLIKCVGANEIRAFRRKGINGSVAHSGELKWIKDWTICVQQTFDSVVDSCGQKGWSHHIRYMTRLVTAMFAEDLLDTHCFLDWVIDSFANAPINRLPIWIFVTRLFFKHIYGLQHEAISLADACLVQLEASRGARQDDDNTLVASLEDLFFRLAFACPACLIGTRDPKLLETGIAAVEIRYTKLFEQHMLASIVVRNERLHSTPQKTLNRLQTADLRVLHHLDNLPLELKPADVVRQMQNLGTPLSLLVAIITDWTCSSFRSGVARHYVGTRLLRYIADTYKEDLAAPIIGSISDWMATQTLDYTRFVRFVQDLVSSGHFNFNTYLQWMVSSGTLSSINSTHLALIHSVSADHLSTQSRSLRQAILSRLVQAPDTRDETHVLMDEVSAMFNAVYQPEILLYNSTASRLKHLAASSRIDMINFVVRKVGVDHSKHEESQDGSDLSASAFLLTRTLLEALEAFEDLHRIMTNQIPLTHSSNLIHYCDTVVSNRRVFGALEVLGPLTVLLYRRHIKSPEVSYSSQTFLSSLVDLCRPQPGFSKTLPRLEEDLSNFAQQHTAAVCSPASDSVLTVRSGDITSDDDIDRVLSSGNMMDEQLLGRLFSAIVERSVKWITLGQRHLAKPCRWFGQLKSFDPTTFDRHLNSLLSKLVVNAGTEQVRGVLIALVASDCLKMNNALAIFEQRLDSLESTSAAQAARFAVGCIHVFAPFDDLASEVHLPEIYHYRIEQNNVCDRNPESILHFVRQGLAATTEDNNIIFSPSAIVWLSNCLVRSPCLFAKYLRVGVETDRLRMARTSALLWRLSLGCDHPTTMPQSPLPAGDLAELTSLVAATTAIRLPFTCLVMVQISGFVNSVGSADDSRALTELIQHVINTDHMLWPPLLESAGPNVMHQLFADASDHIITQAMQPKPSTATTNLQADITRWLNVAALTVSIEVDSIAGTLDRVVHVLHQWLAQLCRDAEEEGDDNIRSFASPKVSPFSLVFGESHCAVLELAIICISSASPDVRSSAVCQRLLDILCRLYTQASLHFRDRAFELIEDCALLVAQNLNHSQAIQVYWKLPDLAKQDTYVKFLLGYSDRHARWLVLATRATNQAANAVSPTVTYGGFSTGPRSQPATPLPPLRASGSSMGGQQGLSTPSVPPTPSTKPSSLLAHEVKYTPYVLRRWEMMQDPTPNAGENDASLNLQLLAARKVL